MYPSTAAQGGVVVSKPVCWGQKGCCPPEGSTYLEHSPTQIFLWCCPLNDCRKVARFLFNMVDCVLLSSHFLFRLFLLLMSCKVHPHPGPSFFLFCVPQRCKSVGQVSAMLNLSEIWTFKVHLPPSAVFNIFSSCHSWSCLCCISTSP